MAYQEKEERLEEMPVPYNADFDFPLFGKAFRLRNALEGLVLGALTAVPAFFVLRYFKIHGLALLIYILFAFLGGFLLGNNGINGDTLSRYLLNILRYRKNRKVAYYNPRVKTNKRFFTEESEAEYVIPRERLEELYRRYTGRKGSEEASLNFGKEENGDAVLYFEDDIEELGKPEELMTRREKRRKKAKKKMWKDVEK